MQSKWFAGRSDGDGNGPVTPGPIDPGQTSNPDQY